MSVKLTPRKSLAQLEEMVLAGMAVNFEATVIAPGKSGRIYEITVYPDRFNFKDHYHYQECELDAAIALAYQAHIKRQW